MKLNLTADEVLTSTRAVRKRLDFDKPVPMELITECLEQAVQAPTGSNKQGWEWLVVTDADKRMALAELYRKGFDMYRGAQGSAPPAPDQAQQDRVIDSASFLAENFHRVPVMLIPCMPGRLDGLPNMAATSTLGSIHPATWSFMLAARERALGTAWTTIHLMFEKEAADILGIPFEEYTQTALITVGYSIGTEFKLAKRPPVQTVMHVDTWGDRPEVPA